jgi:hypothetical protein
MEHDPRADAILAAARIAIEVDEGNALSALKFDWSEFYEIGTDESGMWWAIPGDGRTGVAGCGPDALLAAIREDYAARPVST